MKKHIYSLIGTFIAGFYWVIESTIHYVVFQETPFTLFPHDINELWMRSTVMLLILSFGFFADYHSKAVLEKEKQQKAIEIYSSTLSAMQHILSTLLDNVQQFKMEAMNNDGFDKDVLRNFSEAIDKASDLVDKLSRLDVISGNNIRQSIRSV